MCGCFCTAVTVEPLPGKVCPSYAYTCTTATVVPFNRFRCMLPRLA